MSQITTILRGAQKVYETPVLFRSAGAWVKNALAEAGLAEGVMETAGDHVLLIDAPCPELTAAEYKRLVESHLAIGADFTVFVCRMPQRDAADAIVRLAPDTVPVVCARTEAAKVLGTGDLIEAVNTAIASGKTAEAVLCEPVVAVTDGMSAFEAQKRLCTRINMRHIAAGVQIFAPDSVYIAPDAKIGAGTVILPGTIIRGGCTIGSGCTIGPNTFLEQASVGDRTQVNSSQIYESAVGSDATVGPFAYIRPGCSIGNKTRIGDFVELKKAEIGNGTKVSHLTYIGDATVGERVNFGCGTVVVNYDGYHKFHTNIGDDCFIGCNTNLIAPVSLGDRVFTGAGTTVTKDVPDGALVVGRARQTVIDEWNDKRRARMEQEKK